MRKISMSLDEYHTDLRNAETKGYNRLVNELYDLWEIVDFSEDELASFGREICKKFDFDIVKYKTNDQQPSEGQ